MSQILLVRHGQASWGSDDYDVLSSMGEKQCHALGEALAARGIRPDHLIHGSLRRHRQSTEHAVAGAGWDGEVVEDAGWDEFDHVQMLSMHPASYDQEEEMTRAQFQQWFEEATLRWTGGAYDEEYDESFTAFGRRVDAALRRTLERLGRNQTAVVFTSGGPISWVAASLLGGGADIWTQLNPVTVNSSVTKIVVGRRGQTLVSFNEHTHLETAGDGFITYR
jgi:broad specificity phosphatase PhoE